MSSDSHSATETATFGAGCFWCVEAVFQQIRGVLGVESGYAGGARPHPTYEQVCSGATGHAEVCRITFDPSVVGYRDLLEVFWGSHDPTTPNRQGNDVGTQYRSVIFTHSEDQRRLAEEYRARLDEERVFDDPIVTEIVPAGEFYPAEEYHRDYYSRNGAQPYCAFVVRPKVEKVRQVFADRLKSAL